MRIIAGEYRGRTILQPESADTTRPITDRVKQSLFDILSPMIEGSVVYDCFAGTGSMGLESLSRGAAKAVFFERDRSALRRLKQNIQTLGVANRSQIVSADIFRHFAANEPIAQPVGIVFLDPPYRFLNNKADQLQSLAAALPLHLSDGGVVVFRHDAKDRLELPALARYDERSYGSMTLEFLRRVRQNEANV